MKKSVIIVVLLLISVSLVSAKIVDIPSVSDQGELTDGEDIPPEPLVEQNLGVTRYTYAGNTLVASQHNGNVKYYHQDRLGSNRIVTDSSGVVDSEYLSLPFGQSVVDDVKYGFTGKELDESGLHYFGARYYDSNLGRFTRVDPVPSEPAYQYVGNNPMNYVDPDGMNREYIVQPGDTFYGIASSHDLTMDELWALNPRIENPESIFSEQVLSISSSRIQAATLNQFNYNDGKNICAAVASACALNAKGKPVDVNSLVNDLAVAGAIESSGSERGRLLDLGQLSNVLDKKYSDVSITFRGDMDLRSLESEINKGNPVVVGVKNFMGIPGRTGAVYKKGHYVSVTGFEYADGQISQISFMDPSQGRILTTPISNFEEARGNSWNRAVIFE